MNFENRKSRLSKRNLLLGGTGLLVVSKLNLPLTSRQQAIVLGNILGDGHIQLSPNKQTARLRFTHSIKQAEYVDWEFKELDWLCKGVSRPKEIIEKNQYHLYRAYTSYCSELTHYHTLAYESTTIKGRRYIKRIPSNFGDYLKDPEALMVWYLDDGTLRLDGGACRLATQNFTIDEHEILKDALWKNFHIASKIEFMVKDQPSLYIPSRRNAAKDFVHLFSDTVLKEIPSMTYKIKRYV